MKKLSALIFAFISFLFFAPFAFASDFTVNSYTANPPGDLQINYSDTGHSDCTNFAVHRASDNVQVYGFGTNDWSGLSCTRTGISFTNAPLGNNNLPDGDYYLVLSNANGANTWSETSQTFHLTSNSYGSSPTPIVPTPFTLTYYHATPPGTFHVEYSDIGHSDCTNFAVHRASDNVQVYGFGTSDWSGLNCTSTYIDFSNAPLGDNNMPDGDYYLVLSNFYGSNTWSETSQTFHLTSNLYPSNAAPVIGSLANATNNEGATYSATGSFTDSDSTSWTATVDYGDGGGAQSLSLSGTNFSLNHVYQDNGTYTATVSVTDNQGATGTGTATVTVNNVAPTPGAITAPSSPVLVNTAITASANFTDPGVLDTHSASWNWGDGNNTIGTVTESNGSGSVSNSHTYTATGVYMITLTVTDKDGGVGTSTFQYVSVYDSNSSFAGGRSFDNPSSASPSTTGKVSFGISAKYNNSNVLTGNAKMDFKAASLDFVSTSLQSLATSNGKAYLKGTGTLNGSGTYTFLASGIDGSVAGGNDLIRFQIKDSSNNVVYDSQPGAGDTADPTTTDATGNIRVH